MSNTTDPKVQAVQRLYAAFGRGDIDGVVAELSDDVDWAAEAAGSKEKTVLFTHRSAGAFA